MEFYPALLCAAAAFLVGMAKNGVPGLGILIVPVMAMAFPAKQSVGALLPLLIVGDLIAVRNFTSHTQWSKLWGLFPWVMVGLALGFVTLKAVNSAQLAPLLGALVLGMLVVERTHAYAGRTARLQHPVFTATTGLSAGFATCVGNVAGPVMSIYLIARNLPKHQFVGTAAWFFLLVNVAKLPLFVPLGMITRSTLLMNALCIPLVAGGALVGTRILHVIPQRIFNGMVVTLSVLAALKLLLG